MSEGATLQNMPELPEVETVRRGLEEHLLGQRLNRVLIRRHKLRIPIPDNFIERIKGSCFDRFDRVGKYILAYLDNGMVIIIHLGMSGRFSIERDALAPKGPHDHVVFYTHDGAITTFTDHRRFGLITLCSGNEVQFHPLLAKLGPDPFSDVFDGNFLSKKLVNKKKSIKVALLDQTIISGLGNIYACEALYYSGISPNRSTHTIKGKRAKRLAIAIRTVLSKAIIAGGSSLRDHKKTDGEMGYFQHQFSVYDREGKTCPNCNCNKSIKRIFQNGRSTYYCSTRQR